MAFKYVEPWERFNLVWDEWTCTHAPYPAIHWTKEDCESSKEFFLGLFRYEDAGVKRLGHKPPKGVAMSFSRKDCEEITKAEMEEIRNCLSPEEVHDWKMIGERLTGDQERDYRLALMDASRIVLEGKQSVIPGEREQSVKQAAEVIRSKVLVFFS